MKEEDVDKLPRKLKKKRYGTRGRRKHLAMALLDNPNKLAKIFERLYPSKSILSLNLLMENG